MTDEQEEWARERAAELIEMIRDMAEVPQLYADGGANYALTPPSVHYAIALIKDLAVTAATLAAELDEVVPGRSAEVMRSLRDR